MLRSYCKMWRYSLFWEKWLCWSGIKSNPGCWPGELLSARTDGAEFFVPDIKLVGNNFKLCSVSKGRSWNGNVMELIDCSQSFAVIPLQRMCTYYCRNCDPHGGRLEQFSANHSHCWTKISKQLCGYQTWLEKQHKINRQVCVCCNQCFQA